MKFLTEKNYSLFFDIGIIIKAVITVFELILGFMFYAMSTEAINGVLTFFIGAKLMNSPGIGSGAISYKASRDSSAPNNLFGRSYSFRTES
jgi:uncharacterized membrane protein